MKGGWRMEFINIQNKEGVTIINDTYDNLVYLSFPKQKEAVLYTGTMRGITPTVQIPLKPVTYAPMLVPTSKFQYGYIAGEANVIQVFYITNRIYHGDAPLIAVSVPQGYEFAAQWVHKRREQLMVLIVDVIKPGEKVTQAMVDEVKAGIKFYCFGYFEDVTANADTPRIRFVDKVGSSKPNTALQVLGRHKYYKASWATDYNLQNDVIYDSRIRYLRVIDHYAHDWYNQLSNYVPDTFTNMARDPKTYGVKVAVMPMSVIDVSVWGPNINNGDKKSHTGRVWQTFRFHDESTVSLKSYQFIDWNTVTTYPVGCSGKTTSQYLVVDVTGYDKHGTIPFN